MSAAGRLLRHSALSGAVFGATAIGLLTIGGCRVQVNKNEDGQSKKVAVDTPFGGLRVNTDPMNAGDLGMAVYPGATVDSSKKDNSADVHMGFGQWQLKVKVVNYVSDASRDQVMNFYRKELGRFGDVIECQHDKAVGEPTVTREGLTCEHEGKSAKVQIDSDGLELRAGSKHRQHIVGFDKPTDDGKTRFALISLELPNEMKGESN